MIMRSVNYLASFPLSVLSLSLCTGLGMSLAVLSVTVAGPAGQQVAPQPWMATLPYGLQFFAVMGAAMPLAAMYGRFGRKPVVLAMCSLGFASGILGYFALNTSSFLLLNLAHICLGAFMSALGSLRFAAADLVPAEKKAGALALTNFGGIFAALIGPTVVRLADPLFGQGNLPSSYLMMSLLLVLMAMIFVATPFRGKNSSPEATESKHQLQPQGTTPAETQAPSEIALFAGWLFPFVLIGGATAYGLMSGLMISSSLEMNSVGVELALFGANFDTFTVNSYLIQLHVLAMFGPSLFTANLLNALGQRRFFALGIVVLACSPIAGLFAPQVWAFAIALFALGLGWNMLYVGGSAVIAAQIQGPQRLRSQGLYDTAASFASASASLTASLLLAALTWQGLQVASIAVVALFAGVALFTGFGLRDRRPRA